MTDTPSAGSLGLLRAARDNRERTRNLAGPGVDRLAPRDHDVLLLARLLHVLDPAPVVVEMSDPPLLYVGILGSGARVSRALVAGGSRALADQLLEAGDERLRSVVELVSHDVGTAVNAAAAPAEGAPVVVILARSERRDLEAHLRDALQTLPSALVVVDGCAGADGVFVQASVAGFLRGSSGAFRFLPLGDVSRATAGSALGIVHSEGVATQVDELLRAMTREYEDLDLLTLIRREDERTRAAARRLEQLERELTRARERAAAADRALRWQRRSLSWRLTTPLRLPGMLARRALGRAGPDAR